MAPRPFPLSEYAPAGAALLWYTYAFQFGLPGPLMNPGTCQAGPSACGMR